MDLYTMTEYFLADEVIDEFVSAIWVERYTSAGEVQLVVPATLENKFKLREGKFLALRGSKEVAQIQTQSIDKNLMTVKGEMLPTFLNQRYSWWRNPASTDAADRVVDWTSTMKPGEFIANVVEEMVINPDPFPEAWADADLEWALDQIDNLTLGAVDASGVAKRMTVNVGPLYDAIQQIAEAEGVGFTMYLDSADEIEGYSLKFTTYKGVDRSSDQEVNPLVRLLPDLDSISDLKEINSIALYKNVCYVYWEGEISVHLAEPSLPAPEGFARRVLVTNPNDQPVGHKVSVQNSRPWSYGPNEFTYVVVDEADKAAFREQHARDALANANYIRTVDGQTSPNNDYQYGVHFGMGDIIELQGLTGAISKARITEYIRSQDKNGERNYPTISVIA